MKEQNMWSKIAAVVITATVLGLAAPASAQMYGGWWGGPYRAYSYGGGWWGGPYRHYYSYYPRRHFFVAPRYRYRSWWGGY
jgi:hypothetical protein